MVSDGVFHRLSAILASIAVFDVAVAFGAKPTFNWSTTKYVYAFGDSYTFVQGTKGLANFSFIGDELHPSFTPEELLENQIIARNTSSDGSNWIEFLTGCLEGRPSECRDHQLWNFAFAGADITKDLLPLHHNFTAPLVEQVQQWAKYAADVVPHPASSTLTVWWIGINDTGDVVNRNMTDWKAFWQQEMAAYFAAVELAYNKGLRGAYVFFNVPPEERSPARVNDPVGGPILKQRVTEFNAALAQSVSNFTTTHPDINVFTFDAHSLFNEVLDNPAAYGFKNTTGFCTCTDPTFFWYNTGHPTEAVHKIIARSLEAQLVKNSEAHMM